MLTIEAFDRSYRINYPGDGRVGSKLINGEPYEKKLLVDCHQRGFTGTAFDIGAHLGNHSLYLAAICGLKVHAWEPHDDSLAQLEANLALNPDLDITVHDWAAGREESRARFTPGKWLEFDPSRDGANLKLDRGHVPVKPVDDHVTVVDLAVIKVDVEGMEADALAGCVGHIELCRPVIYSETHTAESHNAVAEVLAPFGYVMDRRIRMGSVMERWMPR